jgi:hypothetical protein
MSLPNMSDLYNIGGSLFMESPTTSPLFILNKPLFNPNNDIETPLPPSPHSLIFSGEIKKKKEKFTQDSVNRQQLEGRIFHPNSKDKENIFDKMFDGVINQSQIQKKRQKEKQVEPNEFKLGSIRNSALWQRRNQFI